MISNRYRKSYFALAFSLLFSVSAAAESSLSSFVPDFIPDRRPSPSKEKEGHLAFPIYTHVPGIGSTFGFGFLFNNLMHTSTKALGAVTGGDSNLAAFGITEVHVLSKNVFFNFFGYSTRIPFQLYERGGGSSADDYVNLVRKEYGATADLNLNFWERRLQFNFMVAPSRLRVLSARSPDGARFNNSDGNEVGTLGTTARLQLDLTDEDLDPRKGAKFQLIYHGSDVHDAYHSRYYSLSTNVSAFVPVGKASTWGFNVFRSWSGVWDRNTKTAEELRQNLGLNCGMFDDAETRTKCQESEDLRVRERLSENQYGTAGLLGGPTQLRGFPIGRFRGSQSILYATEFRWNLTDENTPFDFGFIRGTRSLLQIAPFLELGASVDPPQTVETAPLHAAYGIGFRMGFSGALLRADIGMSSEGPQFTFFCGYPWDLSIL